MISLPRLVPAALVLAPLSLTTACGDSGREETTAASPTMPAVTLTNPTAPGTTTSVGSSGAGETSTATTDGVEPCPPARDCGDICCELGEACVDGACALDCGDEAPCGVDDPVCCEAGQLCYVGQCVTPGGACSSAVCATKTESDCAEGQICDPQLELCVPNFADPTCAFEPEIGVFDPIPRFTWGRRKARSCDEGCQKEEQCQNDLCAPTWPHVEPALDDEPDFYQCVMSPMVVDLDGDCIPEILFNTYKNSAYTANGILRAIRGDTGAKVWSLLDPEYRTDPGSHPALGDLNGDGSPEIVVPGEGKNLLCVGGDGVPLWKSEDYSFGGRSGSPSIANFDLAGPPEIAFGRAVYNSLGAIAWEAPAGATGANGSVGPLSCVADLTGDGRPELIAGGTVYTFTGTVGVDFAGAELWKATPSDGYCGVADFNGDLTPEVALIASGEIYVFNGQTGETLASVTIPGGGAGGAPNIADFDGDGVADIGTAGGNAYVVARYEGPGVMSVLWEAETKDGSSQRTGSSVFDFDGDGRSEVIYGDEWHLRIYPGTEPDCANQGPGCDGLMTDEEVLFIDINSSRTRSEFPVVADVDGDFKAEIIVSTNNESGQGAIGDAGVEVFEDRLDNWVSTLPVWNQHTYHVTNVGADGSIPMSEPPNWSTPADDPYNSYRRNTQGELANNCAPDLAPADLYANGVDCATIKMSAKVINQGCLGVGPGVNVTFYDVDTGPLGTVQTTSAIPAGGAETVYLDAPAPASPPFDVYVVVDDDGLGGGLLNECIEDNNQSPPVETCTLEG